MITEHRFKRAVCVNVRVFISCGSSFFFQEVAKSLHGLHEMLRACALVAVAASAAAFSAPQVSCERVVMGGRARRPACPRPPTPRVLQPVQQTCRARRAGSAGIGGERGLTACLRRARVPPLLQGLLRSGSPAAARLCAAQNAVRPPAVPRRGAVALRLAVRFATQKRAGRSARGQKRRSWAAYIARAPPAADACCMRGCVCTRTFLCLPLRRRPRVRVRL